MTHIPRIAITAGEPAGIGPDLVVQIAQQDWPAQLVVLSDEKLIRERAQQLNLPIQIKHFDADQSPLELHQPGQIWLSQHDLADTVTAGELNDKNGRYVVDTLASASSGNMSGLYDAIVTGPVHKGIINQAGIPFSGHTEFFANHSNTSDVVMLLATEGLRVALVTTHIPLAYVAKAITAERLTKVATILYADLQTKFGISKPKVLACGLNPHAGEGGHLGREEIEIIEPVLQNLNEQGMDFEGPLPADTLFQPKYLDSADAVLAMYHDQGLPVLKYKGFGNAVNITLGLPYIRTSVDHGTALDLAGTGEANSGSMKVAISHAITMAKKNKAITA